MAATAITKTSDPELHWYTEHDPPSQYLDQHGRLAGVSVQWIQLLQRRLHEPGPIELMPWSRALATAKAGSATVLFETVRTEDRRNEFQWVGPVQIYRIGLFGLKSVVARAANKPLPGHLTACAYRTSAVIADLNRLGFVEGKNLSTTVNAGECFEMLMRHRADVMALTELGVQQLEAQVKHQQDQLLQLQFIAERERYLAFSLDVPVARIERWQHALEQSIADGSMRSIYQAAYPEAMIKRLESWATQAERHRNQP